MSTNNVPQQVAVLKAHIPKIQSKKGPTGLLLAFGLLDLVLSLIIGFFCLAWGGSLASNHPSVPFLLSFGFALIVQGIFVSTFSAVLARTSENIAAIRDLLEQINLPK